jgi:hypothetical protein
MTKHLPLNSGLLLGYLESTCGIFLGKGDRFNFAGYGTHYPYLRQPFCQNSHIPGIIGMTYCVQLFFFSFLFPSFFFLKELLYRPACPQTRNSPATAFPAAELTGMYYLPDFDELFL